MTRPKLLLLAVAVSLAAAGGVWWAIARRGDSSPGENAPPDTGKENAAGLGRGAFIGSSECRSCHEEFYAKWAKSWHGLAMQPYTPEFARTQLRPHADPIEIRGKTYQAKIGREVDAVSQQGPDGTKTYPIAHVLGGKNVYYFLTPVAGGRLQVLPLAFDARKKQWYDTTASMLRHLTGRHDEALDWTERQLTFNASCHGCHVSQISKNYSLATDSYRTTWREPGISCESCHGPGKRHVEAMTARDKRAKSRPDPLHLIVTAGFTPSQMNSLCAQCHAKMTPLTASLPPGEQFFDHFRLGTLEDLDFYPDGRDLGENFTYTTWLMSPCGQSGRLDCMHCHTSSGGNKHAGPAADHACAPCHREHVADPAAHSHHPAASEGSRCVACHMPKTAFARMERHDHSMLSPTPAATIEFDSPNACNLCHADHDARWSDEWVRKWYPRDYQAPVLHRAGLIQAARRGDWRRLDKMTAFVKAPAPGRNEVFAASLLRLMERSQDPRKWDAYFLAASDPSPLVRSAAVAGLAACPEPRAVRTLAAAARDPCRLVRLDAAIAAARHPAQTLAPEEVAAVRKAIAEYETSLRARPDDPASHYNLGNLEQDRGQPAAAIAEYDWRSASTRPSCPRWSISRWSMPDRGRWARRKTSCAGRCCRPPPARRSTSISACSWPKRARRRRPRLVSARP